MTDREKLIELLNGFSTPVTLNGEKLMDWNIPMPGLRKAIADHLLANGVTFQKWIPVSERLPEEDGKYIVFEQSLGRTNTSVLRFAKDARKVDRYEFKGRWKNAWYEYDSEWGHYTVNSVTHWMPLPKPPQEVSDVQT